MKIDREEIIQILKKIKPGISTKEISEQTSHFIFTGKNILTYNGQISISYPFKSEFKGSVPAQEFFEILNRLDDKELEFTIQDDKLQFKTKRTKLELSIITNIDKTLLITPENEWKNLPKNFIDGISFCSFSASKDMTHPVLTSIHISGKHITSSDNYRISRFKMKGLIKDEILFPASVIRELIKFPVIQYSVSESWLFFQTEDNIIFSCRRIEGEFPDVESIFESNGEEIILPEETKKAVDISSILAEGEADFDRKITVKIKNGILTCSGEKEIGKIDFSIKAKELKDKDFEFNINPEFFKMILAKSSSAIIDKDKIIFISENFKHIISLY